MKSFVLAVLILAIVGCRENPVAPAVSQPEQITWGDTVKIDTVTLIFSTTGSDSVFYGPIPASGLFRWTCNSANVRFWNYPTAHSDGYLINFFHDSTAVVKIYHADMPVVISISRFWDVNNQAWTNTAVRDTLFSDTTIYF